MAINFACLVDLVCLVEPVRFSRMLKKAVSKAAGESKPEAYPRGYVEDFDEPRTKLAGCFSTLLCGGGVFFPLREDPLHAHPYHQIRVLHQWLDRIAAPVITDRLERCSSRQTNKPIIVGKHLNE